MKKIIGLEDYEAIRIIIDDIVGVKTMQGNNLKKAIKNYFVTKPISIKLVNNEGVSKAHEVRSISVFAKDSKKAMSRYTDSLKKETAELKKNGEHCGVSG